MIINKEEVSEILHQGHLIIKLNKLYGEQFKGLTTYKMPGTPSVGILRPTDKNEVVFKEEHEHYRTGVGILLYLVKHTQPYIVNAVRELTRLNDGTTGNAMKEMKCVIKYVIDTGNKVLIITEQKK